MKQSCVGETAFRLAEIVDIPQIEKIDGLHRDKQISNAVSHGECYVAERAAKIIGFAFLEYTFFENGFVSLLIITDEHRRQGIGRSLVEYLYCKCKTEKLFTSTNESNAPMRGLLFKTGFTPCGYIDALDEGDPELFFVRRKV